MADFDGLTPAKPRPADHGTVFVVEDEEPMRNALRRLLASAELPVQTFASAAEFLEKYERAGPGCMVLDLHMPGMNGLELQQELQARAITLPVIFLTGAASVPQAVSAMRAGAVNFLEKPFRNEELLEHVRNALELDRRALQQDRRRAVTKQRVATLTPREKEVLVLLSEGQSNKVIARNLQLSPRTVEGYRARFTEKLEAKSVAELVLIVQQCRDLLDAPGPQLAP
jgi:two-component system response regulator FixJ